MGCQQLSPEQQRAIDEYRLSNVDPGVGMAHLSLAKVVGLTISRAKGDA
jgi:hypothetical protein